MNQEHQKIDDLMGLPGPERYVYFIRQVVSWESIWGLWNDGWAMAVTDDGSEALPLWPSEEAASACATEDWSTYAPREIDLYEFMDEVMPGMEEKGILPGIFPTPSEQGVVPPLERLSADLALALDQYIGMRQ